MSLPEITVRNMTNCELLRHLEDLPDALLRELLGEVLEDYLDTLDEIACLERVIEDQANRIARLTELELVEEDAPGLYFQGVAQ